MEVGGGTTPGTNPQLTPLGWTVLGQRNLRVVQPARREQQKHTCCPSAAGMLPCEDNPLYNVFTVRQHLMFFASLRGVSEQLQAAKVMEVLTALGAKAEIRVRMRALGYPYLKGGLNYWVRNKKKKKRFLLVPKDSSVYSILEPPLPFGWIFRL